MAAGRTKFARGTFSKEPLVCSIHRATFSHTPNFANSHVVVHVDAHRRTFVNVGTKGDRTHDGEENEEEEEEEVGAERRRGENSRGK